ncbi:ABC transporter substrate-binding protein [Enterobacter quasiroggenkampii]|uniref:ABC transporter substrate-binding protein n=1 Tax=Enterobacter TaxID=547 RepID=UPI002DBB7618|nr:ABC transporter substrate-binding protein [Enterobacter quasiroggenkampii]MEB6576287.1 ABC transporter substrate-binding protein [Enterobacter quasiroggenkampii]
MMKAFIHCTLLALTAVIVLTANASADPLRTIRIGVPDQSAGSKPFIGGPLGMAYIRHQLEDVFKPQGVSVEWQFFKGAGPAVNEALANQQLDFAWLGDLAAIIGKANGLPTRLLLGSRGSESYLAVTRASGIRSLADLKGKRVAVYRGTADQLAFDRALRTAGLMERSLQVINLDWNAGKAALAAGRVDAVWGGVSLLALRGEKIDVVARSGDAGRQNTTQAALLATQHFIDAWPQATQQIVDVLVKNAAEISDPTSRNAWSAEMAQQSQIPQALFLEELRPDDLNFTTSPRIDPFLTDSFSQSVEQAQASRLIRSAFDARQWAEGKFVEQALTTLKLEARWPLYDADGQPR